MAVHVSTREPGADILAINFIKSGSVIAVPTDTIYGFACDATSIASIEKLYAIKCRNEEKPVAICLGDISDVKVWAKVEHLPKGLLENLLPGPVTLILNCANKLDASLCCKGKVGIRIPDCSFIRSVARGLKRPIALTSANISSHPSSLTIFEFEELWDKIDAVFNGGNLGKDDVNRKGSTIIDLSQSGSYAIVRQGIAFNPSTRILQQFGLINQYE